MGGEGWEGGDSWGREGLVEWFDWFAGGVLRDGRLLFSG